MMLRSAKTYVAGHRGLAGSAIARALTAAGCDNVITRTHQELDLTDQAAVHRFFAVERPDCVFLAAARVGGILANRDYPAEFIQQNLAIQTNVIHECWRAGVKRLLFLGSSCVFPRDCPQPMKEEHLLTGPLEDTNRAYAVAKIAGIEMCWSYNRQYGTRFLAVMPTNLFGPGDNYDLQTSHVLPALIRKFHEARASGAREVVIWGTGSPRREFLHSDEMADAALFLMSLPDARFAALTGPGRLPLVNIGAGKDISIRDLARLVADIVGFKGELVCDPGKPDGTPRKLLDVALLRGLGWQPSISLESGIRRTYEAFLRDTPTP